MDVLRVVVSSECNNRTTGERALRGQTIEVTREEYERLLKAMCIDPLPETATTAPPENAAKKYLRRPKRK